MGLKQTDLMNFRVLQFI